MSDEGYVVNADGYQVLIDADWGILINFLLSEDYSKTICIVDENTRAHCLHILRDHISTDLKIIEISSGEENKNLDTAKQIWEGLLAHGCDRKSLVLNLGGGVIGDIGGFCASTYMRGIDFIQIPTTLLSQVDASVGGKLGIDFNHLKNMVGVFNNPKMVWIQSNFLKTLPYKQLRSGYAEVIKHTFIKDKLFWNKISTIENPAEITNWNEIIHHSVKVKNAVVTSDPFEKGLRKILNFGHSLGHSIESLLLNSESPLLHGEAIAIGMILEAHIAMQKQLLEKDQFQLLKEYISKIYFDITPKDLDLDDIITLARRDKKNLNGEILIATIGPIGQSHHGISVSKEEIALAFADFNA